MNEVDEDSPQRFYKSSFQLAGTQQQRALHLLITHGENTQRKKPAELLQKVARIMNKCATSEE